MYSSSSPHELDAFAGLDIGDDYDMAPRTRQQTRAGVHYSEGQFYYTVNVQRPDGSSAQVLHSYDLPFEPENPNPLRDAISYQGRNISYDIKASQAGGRIQFDFMERVSVWVNSVNNPPILQCNCSHQLQDEACKHIYYVLGQIGRAHIEYFDRRSRSPRTMSLTRAGTRVSYDTNRTPRILDDLLAAIGDIGGTERLRQAMSRYRLLDDAMQNVLYRRDRIEKSFERLDDYVLGRDHMEAGQDVETCAAQLVEFETIIFNEFHRVNRDDPEQVRPLASQAIVPTLLFLLEGVVKRHRVEMYSSATRQLILPSSDLYGEIIRQSDPRYPFILRTLREIPPEAVRPEFMVKKIAIQRMMHELTATAGTQDAAAIYLEHLARLWRGV